jgi:hypothetical protein
MQLQNPETSLATNAGGEWYANYPGLEPDAVKRWEGLMVEQADIYYGLLEAGQKPDTDLLAMQRPGYDDNGRQSGQLNPVVEAMAKRGYLVPDSFGRPGALQISGEWLNGPYLEIVRARRAATEERRAAGSARRILEYNGRLVASFPPPRVQPSAEEALAARQRELGL